MLEITMIWKKIWTIVNIIRMVISSNSHKHIILLPKLLQHWLPNLMTSFMLATMPYVQQIITDTIQPLHQLYLLHRMFPVLLLLQPLLILLLMPMNLPVVRSTSTRNMQLMLILTTVWIILPETAITTAMQGYWRININTLRSNTTNCYDREED